GNVRELRNAVEHAHLLSSGVELEPEALPDDILQNAGVALPQPSLQHSAACVASKLPSGEDAITLPLSMKMDDVEQRFILAVYEKAKGNKTQAAKMLGIGLKTLYRKLVKYGMITQEEKIEEE